MEIQHFPLVEMKGSAFTLPVIHLRTLDLGLIKEELEERLAKSLAFFANAPVVIDLGDLQPEEAVYDFDKLKVLLRGAGLLAVGIHRCPDIYQEQALHAELAILRGGSSLRKTTEKEKNNDQPAVAPPPQEQRTRPLIVDKPVRSGQQVYAVGTDLIVLAPVNAGAEILADGNIHVYAPLRGHASAGVTGDTSARIFTLSLEAQLISIAGHYRLFDEDPPEKVYKKSVQAYLDDDRVIITPIS